MKRLTARRWFAFPICLAVLSLVPAPGSCQSDELLAAREWFRELYEKADYREAEPAALEALVLAEAEFGPDHPEVAIGLNDLASLYWTLDRGDEAAARFARARQILEGAPAPYHVMAMGVFNNITVLLDESGEWVDVEHRYLQVLEEIAAEFGARSALYARAYSNLGGFYKVQGRFVLAEEHYREAIEIKRETLGRNDPSVAVSLSNLANLFEIQGRGDKALELHEEALSVRRVAYPPGHPEIAFSLDKLGSIYRDRGRFDKAGSYYEQALASYRVVFDEAHSRLTLVLRNLASLRFEQGEYEQAEAGYKELLKIRRRTGPAYPQVPTALVDLANLYWHLGRYKEAEPLYLQALAIQRAVLPEGHPEIALTLNNLANLYYADGRYKKALEVARQSSAIYRERAARFRGRELGVLSEQRKNRHAFLLHALTALGVAAVEPRRHDELLAEAFEAGQLAHATSTAAAVARMAARFAAAGDELAQLVRARQDAIERWLDIDELLLESLTLPPEERDIDEIRARSAELDREIDELDARLREDYAEYSEMVGQRPVELAEIQRQLGPGEALVSFAVWGDRTFVWGVRRDRIESFFEMLGEKELGRKVRTLRRGLKVSPGRPQLPEFKVETAAELYERLLAPLAELLADSDHLFVVPDGPLTGLPLGLLVTAPTAQPGEVAGYSEVPWLAKQVAVTVLPAASSLTALRVFARRSRGDKAYLGIGDPLLEGEPGGDLGARLSEVFPKSASQEGGVDPARLRRLSRLPDTADELRQIASLLEVRSQDALYLGKRASEATIRSLMLADYRIVQFATHGLVAGEIAGVPEPALVLTPPAAATPDDDGLLYASEIAQLELGADWVVLSACNTAAGENGTGEGLSGLAKAFFYAGSRTLLVSHWPVESTSAVRLTTGMFAELAADPAIGRAEALRRSMLEVMADDAYAHPLYWAPFEVVGEGGAKPSNEAG